MEFSRPTERSQGILRQSTRARNQRNTRNFHQSTSHLCEILFTPKRRSRQEQPTSPINGDPELSEYAHAPAAERQVFQGQRPRDGLERLVEALSELERLQPRRPLDAVNGLVELPPCIQRKSGREEVSSFRVRHANSFALDEQSLFRVHQSGSLASKRRQRRQVEVRSQTGA